MRKDLGRVLRTRLQETFRGRGSVSRSTRSSGTLSVDRTSRKDKDPPDSELPPQFSKPLLNTPVKPAPLTTPSLGLAVGVGNGKDPAGSAYG